MLNDSSNTPLPYGLGVFFCCLSTSVTSTSFRSTRMQRLSASTSAATLVLTLLNASAIAQPTNTTLPPGTMWSSTGTGTYDTMDVGTPTGGFPVDTDNDGTPDAYSPAADWYDTSFGVMDEVNAPWFDGSDLGPQQFIQAQAFGNSGANLQGVGTWGSSPFYLPSGAPDQSIPEVTQRWYNYAYQGTTAGDNFPSGVSEQRSVNLTHWTNPSPDSGGVAAVGQTICVPTSAFIEIDFGFGSDEMYLEVIEGVAGGRPTFRIDVDQTASYSINGTGAYTGTNSGTLEFAHEAEYDNAGTGNAYRTDFGLGGTEFDGNAANVSNTGNSTWGGTSTATTQGIPMNSVGTSIFNINGSRDTVNIPLGSIIENGGAFGIDFDSMISIAIDRVAGVSADADARASTGPGMQGVARYVVNYEHFEVVAVPEPTSGLMTMLAIAGLGFARRRRS